MDPQILLLQYSNQPPSVVNGPFFPQKVSDLIDGESHEWKVDLIRGLFGPDDAEHILSTQVSTQGVADKGIWHHTADGKFSIRSAYHVARSLSFQRHSTEKGETSHTRKAVLERNGVQLYHMALGISRAVINLF